MKKFLVVFGLVLVSVLAQSQVRLDVMTGISSVYSQTDKDHVGSYCLGVSINKLYVDLNTNFLTENTVKTSPTYIQQALSVKGFNVGYVLFKKGFSIIPVFGYYQFNKIVQDPIILLNPQITTIYNYESSVNVGCNVRYVHNHVGLMAGLGLVDRFKLTLVFRL